MVNKLLRAQSQQKFQHGIHQVSWPC